MSDKKRKREENNDFQEQQAREYRKASLRHLINKLRDTERSIKHMLSTSTLNDNTQEFKEETKEASFSLSQGLEQSRILLCQEYMQLVGIPPNFPEFTQTLTQTIIVRLNIDLGIEIAKKIREQQQTNNPVICYLEQDIVAKSIYNKIRALTEQRNSHEHILQEFSNLISKDVQTFLTSILSDMQQANVRDETAISTLTLLIRQEKQNQQHNVAAITRLSSIVSQENEQNLRLDTHQTVQQPTPI